MGVVLELYQRRRGLTEFQVYEQICQCVQQGKEIDWFDLCQEAGFSPQIVFEINDAKEKAKEALNEPLEHRLDEFGRVPVECGHHVRHLPLLCVLHPSGIHVVFLENSGWDFGVSSSGFVNADVKSL